MRGSYEKALLNSRPRAAERWGVCLRTVDSLIAAGKVRVVRIQGRVLIPEEEVLRIANEGTEPERNHQPVAEVAATA